MYDAQLDAVYSAMKKLGYEDVDIVVAETGWPSAGDPTQPEVNLQNALSYNGNLVKHVNSGKGTPLMPNRTFETYIFSLFNENLKPSTSERNFGLFKPDLTPVYDVGILRIDQVIFFFKKNSSDIFSFFKFVVALRNSLSHQLFRKASSVCDLLLKMNTLGTLIEY